MMVVTGAAGFIGSCVISRLNEHNFNYIIAVDDFSDEEKNKNLENKTIQEKVDRKDFFNWLEKNKDLVEFIIHMGARTDTFEMDEQIFQELNIDYTKKIWKACVDYQIPLVYASSAATYGRGEKGYSDKTSPEELEPLNPYGRSKNDFDKWALKQDKKPFFWAGLKFFNVYGPNEYHKDKMASVIFHTFHQVKKNGEMKLFRSHNPNFKDGEQSRDFIYVKDVTDVIMFLIHHRENPGIYNLGSGKARTFLDLAKDTFRSMGSDENISFIDTPEHLRDKYQYFTEADMSSLRNIGYEKPFHTLEEGIEDYVKNYLMQGRYY